METSFGEFHLLSGWASIDLLRRKRSGDAGLRQRLKTFLDHYFPLLAPTGFFLLVINLTYSFFETFGVIDTMTNGGPGGGTTSLVYKVYRDGFVGADLGGSSAQSVVLLLLVLTLTFIQFRVVEKRVHY